MVAVVVCAWMQIRVNYQIYPFEPVIETALDEETRAQIEHEGQRKTLWHRKTEAAPASATAFPRASAKCWQTLLKGRDAKYIMDKFYISQSTAKTHIYNIYRKFGVHSRQELLDFIEEIELAGRRARRYRRNHVLTMTPRPAHMRCQAGRWCAAAALVPAARGRSCQASSFRRAPFSSFRVNSQATSSGWKIAPCSGLCGFGGFDRCCMGKRAARSGT